MKWNWQQSDWPEFRWNASRLRKTEEHFLVGGGIFAGTLKHLDSGDREQLTIEAISSEALTTSEIEGEILDRASVQSSIRKQFGLDANTRAVKPGEQGIAEMMVDLFRSFDNPLSDQTLFDWHRRVVQGRADVRDVGKYRTGRDAMRVVSGVIYSPTVHLEAPPSSMVPKEMARFLKWFNRTGPTGTERFLH